MQKKVLELCTKYKLKTDAQHRLLDVMSELGEFSKEILISTHYGKERVSKATPDMIMEFGDVMFSMLCVANELSIDAEQALNLVLAKYEQRFQTKKDISSGSH